MATITLSGLKKSYGQLQVIHGLDLKIENGEFVTLVGPSGCGKSTLLRMIAGLEDISDGVLQFDESVVNALSPAQREVAMVFQSYALYPHMSVRKNLSFGLENLSMPRAEIARRISDAARMLDIEAYLDRKPKALSGGQRQRVAIGRAIVRNPRVFLFDEPLSNLDAKLRVQTRSEITRLHRQLETTMVYVTHDQVEAMTMSQKIVVMNGGRIEQVGAPLDLFERPANLFVAGFIGSPQMNFYPGRVRNGQILVEGASAVNLPFSVAEGREVSLGVRPSHFRIDPDSPLRFRVEQAENMGHETFLYGQLGDVQTILHVAGHRSATAGEEIPISPDPAQLHVFDAGSGQRMEPHA